MTSNRILRANVNTTLGKDNDPVKLDLKFDAFPDGTIFTAQTTLNAEAKKVTLVIQNSGYRKVAP